MAENLDLSVQINLANENFLKSLKNIEKSLDSLSKKMDASFKKSAKPVEETSQVFDQFGRDLEVTAGVIGGLSASLIVLSKNFSGVLAAALVKTTAAAATITQDFQVFGQTILKANKNFFGFTKSLAVVGFTLTGIGTALIRTDERINKFIGSFSILVGILTGALSFGVIKLVTGLGQLSQTIGNSLVSSVQSAVREFAEFDRSTLIFTRTLQGFNDKFGESQGTIESWSRAVDDAVRTTTFSRGELQKAASELVAAGAQLDLSEDQLRGLFNAVQDYGTITGDVFQTTIDFVGALQGQSQSVIKYGIKLNETSLQQQAFKEGISESVSKLNEQQKTQLRLNKIFDLYPTIAGKAAAISSSFAGQSEKLSQIQSEINRKFGEGASIIENFSIATASLNSALNIIPDALFRITGFLGALGGRVLQVGGFFLKWSFNIFAVIEGIKLLNVALASQTFTKFSSLTIPLINKSLQQLAILAGGTATSLTSVNGILNLLRVSAIRLSRTITTRLLVALRGVLASLAAFALTPVGALLTGIAVTVLALGKAFQFLENRTKVFSSIFKNLGKVFKSATPAFKPLVDLFVNLGNEIAEAGRKIAGFFIDKVAGAIKFVVDFLKSNPLNIFDEESVKSLDETSSKLANLRKQIKDVGFDIAKLPPVDVDVRSIAGKADIAPVKETIQDAIKRIRDEFSRNLSQANRQIITARIAGATDEEIDRLSNKLQNELKPSAEAARQALFNLYNETGDTRALDAANNVGQSLLSLTQKATEEASNFQQTVERIPNTVTSDIGGAFSAIAEGSKQADESFKEFASNFISRISRMIFEALLLDTITKSISNFGGGGSSQSFSSLFKDVDGLLGLFNGGVIKRAGGGPVQGAGTGTSDSVPAMSNNGQMYALSNGEYVLKASSVKSLGLGFMNRLNNLGAAAFGIPTGNRLATGGFIDSGEGSDFNTQTEPNLRVMVENKGTPQEATQVRTTTDARGTVVNIVLDDLERNGPINKALNRRKRGPQR